MKCTSKKIITGVLLLFVLVLAGCGKEKYSYQFSRSMDSNAYTILTTGGIDGKLESFSEDICVDVASDHMPGINMAGAKSSGLFDLHNEKVLYANNIYEELPPASITKIMTALCAIKYGNLDSMITVSGNCKITESGAQKIGIEQGDTLTLEQALNILLLYSANDVAVAIAENVAGSEAEFVNMMNAEAKKLGATHTNFCNPHGLNAENHYTTVYDLYLIMNEVTKYDTFNEIVSKVNYSTTIGLASGERRDINIDTTNQYLKGNQTSPESITVLGGKTGTTAAAGNCLIIYSQDNAGNKYISVVLGDDSKDNLYVDMNTLLEAAGK